MKHFTCDDLPAERLDDKLVRTLARVGKMMIARTDVGPGEMISIPANITNGAETVETLVACNIFTPPREDRLKGEDMHHRAAKA